MINYFLFGTIAYLLGSIPTAIWIGKWRYGIDIREHGSKNAGATNTFRVLGKKPGIIVLCIDIVKGFIATYLPVFFLLYTESPETVVNIQLIAGVFAVLGHILPVFEHFKGGKGVATSLGVVIGIHPPAAGICIVLFLIVFLISHYVSLGAICVAFAFPFIVEFVFHNDFFWLSVFSIVLSSSVLFSHRKNIKRLLKGEESKMNLFQK
jgi:glycerol-3-phosphate acyltransferase PlsY